MDTVDLSKSLHVVSGHFAAASLKEAFRLSDDQVLINEDDLHCGPAPAPRDLHLWRRTRESYMNGIYSCLSDDPTEAAFSFDGYTDVGLLMNAARLGEDRQVLVWTAQGLHEQLLLAWVVFLFDRLGFDPATLRAVHFRNLRPQQQVLGIGELSPENIREFYPGPNSLGTEERDELGYVWNAYTSTDPATLSAYLAGPTCLPLLHKAMSRLIYRYPDVRSGLSLCDTWLLHQMIEHGPLPARVIGWTFAINETPDQVGDSYLFERLRRLGSSDLPSPLVSITGNTRSMRESRVEITDFGRKVLAGEANHVAENGIDDWIGGVHLTPDTVVFRDGGTLLLS